jgi:hypothetical protein
MYGKVFASMFTGSMMGVGSHVYSVMTYAIVNADADGFVELNARLLSVLIGDPQDRIEEAIAYLCQPDPDSRTPDQEGRRLLKKGQFLYQLVNYAYYREIRNREDRREQNREAKRRERQKAKSADVSTCQQCQHMSAMSAQAEAEVEEKEESKKKKPASRPRGRKPFTLPTVEQVGDYAESLGYPNFDAKRFIEYYAERNWLDSKGQPVRDWKAKLRNVWLKDLKKPQRGDPDWLPTESEVEAIYSECGETTP